MKKQVIFSLSFFVLLLLGACTMHLQQENIRQNNEKVHQPSDEDELLQTDLPKNPNIDEKPEIIEKSVSFTAIGDILIHDRVYRDAYDEDHYDFMPMLEPVKNYLNDTVITFANQETMIGGVEHGLSSYPVFNSPVEVGDALKEVGVNIVSLANNHTLDRGEEVIQSAIRHWEDMGMMYVGSYKNEEDRNEMRIFETNEGITVGFLAYTYGTNGIPVPEGKDYLVNLIDRELIASDIEEMKEAADVTIISLHFGTEYERMPNEEQKDLVQYVADLGVDAVIGHHPHVLQPVEWVTGENGNKTFVIYSLGNFLSGQDTDLYRQIGGVVKFTIKQTIKDGESTIHIEHPQFLPTYNASSNETDYRVYPLFEVTDDMLPNAKKHYEEIKQHMSQWMPELEFMEQKS